MLLKFSHLIHDTSGSAQFFFMSIHELFLKRKREEHLRDPEVRLCAISISSLWVFKSGLSIGIALLYGTVPPMVSQWSETIIIFVRASVLHSISFCAAFSRIVTSERQLGFSYKGASLWVAPLPMRDEGSLKLLCVTNAAQKQMLCGPKGPLGAVRTQGTPNTCN